MKCGEDGGHMEGEEESAACVGEKGESQQGKGEL